MPCSSLVALARACGAEGIAGGIEKLYAISYNDLNPAPGLYPFTLSVGGLVNTIALDATKKFTEISILKNTVKIEEVLTKDLTKGSSFYTVNLTGLTLSGLSIENQAFVKSVADQPVAILVKTRNTKWFVLGLNGELELNSAMGDFGTAEGDLQGYVIGFTGVATSLIPGLDITILSTLI